MYVLHRKGLLLPLKIKVFMMKKFLYMLVCVLLFASCTSGKPKEEVAGKSDSLASALDTCTADSVPNPPKAADGLFDDFIYSFMCNKRFQYERIIFPLKNVVDGVNQPIAKGSWKFDHLYEKQDVYTLVFDNSKSIKAEKDTSLHHVVFEWVYLTQRKVKQYVFDKMNGQWFLTALDTHKMSKNVNSDFYEFYAQFSSNHKYQSMHILNPFHFKTYDYENFQSIEGLLDVNQWPDYRPKLPSGTITNINYGQGYGNSRRRVLMICSQSGGMGCSLTFVRNGKTWMLERLEN